MQVMTASGTRLALTTGIRIRRAAAAVALVLVVALLATSPGGERFGLWANDLIQLAAAALAAAACLRSAARLRGRRQRAFRALGAGCLAWAGGQAAYSWWELVVDRPVPLPGLPDLGFLLFPVGGVAALLLFPTQHSGGRERLRSLFDGLIVAVAAFSVSWATALGVALRAGGDLGASLVTAAYPLTDVAMVTVALTLLARAKPADRAVPGLLALGLLAMALSDSSYAYLTATGAYGTGNVLDAGWVAAFVLIALAASEAAVTDDGVARDARPVPWRALVPYVALLPALGVLVRGMSAPGSGHGVELTSAGVLILLVLGRQVLALRENEMLVLTVRAREQELVHQASHDALTGLANRALFTGRLEQRLAGNAEGGTAVVFVDLDGFKLVNDTLGHHVGDQLLIGVADRLLSALRGDDLVARLGGDEFAVLLGAGSDLDVVARRLSAALAPVFVLPDRELAVRASIGIARAVPGASAAGLLQDADLAMYAVKRDGGGGTLIYDTELREAVATPVELRADLRAALAAKELRVAYQPQVDLRTGALVGVEALARWTHPARGPVPPDVFVRLAEEAGMVDELDGQVLEQACAALAVWRRTEAGRQLRLSVNISPRHLVNPALLPRVLAALEANDVPPHALSVEVTEHALSADLDVASAAVRGLVDAGVSVALDDFGTGWSSLARLASFPIELLKVDRSFVAGTDTPRAAELLAAIVRLGHSLGLRTLLEGIETADQWEAAVTAGCELGQGWVHGHPGDAESVAALLRQVAMPASR